MYDKVQTSRGVVTGDGRLIGAFLLSKLDAPVGRSVSRWSGLSGSNSLFLLSCRSDILVQVSGVKPRRDLFLGP
jgi:hypothetical protein